MCFETYDEGNYEMFGTLQYFHFSAAVRAHAHLIHSVAVQKQSNTIPMLLRMRTRSRQEPTLVESVTPKPIMGSLKPIRYSTLKTWYCALVISDYADERQMSQQYTEKVKVD
jgi:hypothetical protein